MNVKEVRNWVFLGDSLTEGIGSPRLSYVTELIQQLRSRGGCPFHMFRLRQWPTIQGSTQVRYNRIGYLDHDPARRAGGVWIWNLAEEGTMSGNDMEWMPLLDNLSPEKVFILRGGLESVVRPATVHSGRWPWWIPAAWRGYAAMDPRCYFSTGRLRRAKQQLIDLIKQVIRKKLLTESLSAPLMGVDQLHANLTQTVTMAKSLGSEVFILDLPPISEKQFPGSSMQFQLANAMFRQLSTETGAVNVAFNLLQPDDFYLDGFHPNSQGNEKMASSIFQNVINDN